jgi:anti-anti-sigma factor
MTLSVTTTRDADTCVVGIGGDIDLATVATLERAVLAAFDTDATTVVVDLAAVTFLDSAGINTLLKSRRLADEQDRRFRVTGATGVVHDVLDMTGVLAHLSG